MKNIVKKISTLVLAAALVVTVAAGLFTAPAQAVSGVPDPSKTSTLTVHKYEKSGASTQVGDGLKITDSSKIAGLGTPMKGVEFTLHRIDPDAVLTKDSKPEDFIGKSAIINIYTETTNDDGEIIWENLPHGYYVLEETWNAAENGYTAAAPAIITLPYGYDGNTPAKDYNYDVHVYPKNITTASVSKKVVNGAKDVVVGEEIDWKISGKLTLSDGDTEFTNVVITDPLDDRLEFVSVEIKLVGGGGDFGLTKDIHYTESGNMVWTLTQDGLDKIKELGSTAIEALIKTTVKENAQNGGTGQEQEKESIKNGGSVTINSDKKDVPTPPVVDLGGITIDKVDGNKTDEDGQKVKLTNAKFKIALTEADATSDPQVFLKDAQNNDIEVTTDGNGYAQFVDFTQVASPGIDWSTVNTFWLVETQAPDNYLLKNGPIKVETKDGEGNPLKSTKVTIENQEQGKPPVEENKPSFTLPLTGSMGTILFTVLGLLMMVGAVVLLQRRKKA